MEICDGTKAKGSVEVIIEDNSSKEIISFNNTVLLTGKYAVAQLLANQYGTVMESYINKMLFGTNGTIGGVPKVVEESRTGLFGTTLLTKSLIASIESTNQSQITLTAVIGYAEAIGSTINELALELKNEDLYAMATFGGIAKTGSMQITFNWRIRLL